MTTAVVPSRQGTEESCHASIGRKKTIYRAAIVSPASETEVEVLSDALLCVSAEGRIEWVEDLSSHLPDGDDDDGGAADEDAAFAIQQALAKYDVQLEEVDFVRLDEGFLSPGFVDTHTHAPQYINNGVGSDHQLMAWLKTVTFPTEQDFEDVEYASMVYGEVVKRSLRAGTTTSCYYATVYDESSRALADICVDQGQRAFIGKCCMDRLCPPTYIETTESSLAHTRSFLEHFDTLPLPPDGMPPLVQPIITPRFAVSCTPALLQGLGDIAASRTPSYAIQTHMSENKLEILLVADQFKDENCHTYASVYEKYGLLGEGTILAHCVHLDKQEREVIKRTGAGVSHCPSSNLFLSSGLARIRDLLHEGIKVGLGTDCSGGPHISILGAIRDASNVSRAISFTDEAYKPLTTPELFYLATMGGARLCRLQDTIGSLQPGKDFDAVWVKPGGPGMWHGMSRAVWLARQEGGAMRRKRATKEDVRRVWAKWIWTGDDRDLGGVWVRGRRVVP